MAGSLILTYEEILEKLLSLNLERGRLSDGIIKTVIYNAAHRHLHGTIPHNTTHRGF
jgi:hypothetical protein